MDKLILNLEKQLREVIKQHQIEVNNDTYWRGVRIGLETAINVANDMCKNKSSHCCLSE